MATLTETIGTMTRDDLMARLDRNSVPCGPVRNVDEVLNDTHPLARRNVRQFEHPRAGLFEGLALPFKFDGFDDPSFERPPLLGEHTDAVLGGLLNYDGDRIAQLRQEKVV